MDDNSKKTNLRDSDKVSERDSANNPNSDNPGLKDEERVKHQQAIDRNKDLWNEDPIQEKQAIEQTSEDRLSEAE
ncbi:MAG: hypothetical protein WCF67_06105 [Chitinophagaceae bacterium]